MISGGDVVDSSQVGKTGGLYFASIRAGRAVGNQIDAELAFGGFDGGVGGAWGHLVPLRPELEVVNHRLHVIFHSRAARWRKLAVVHLNTFARTQISGRFQEELCL